MYYYSLLYSIPSHGGNHGGRGSGYNGPGGGSFHRHSPRQSPALQFRFDTRSRTPPPRHHSPRQERHAGPCTQAPFRAKQSQSPVGNGHGVNVTEKPWSCSPSPRANVARTRSLSPE
ncbi:hypothetical protein CY35_19G087300 [Sphagnum magellanicum]|nr:hypothetical protein CY35_19G087300 [Sphagnum magellanicum]